MLGNFEESSFSHSEIKSKTKMRIFLIDNISCKYTYNFHNGISIVSDISTTIDNHLRHFSLLFPNMGQRFRLRVNFAFYLTFLFTLRKIAIHDKKIGFIIAEIILTVHPVEVCNRRNVPCYLIPI